MTHHVKYIDPKYSSQQIGWTVTDDRHQQHTIQNTIKEYKYLPHITCEYQPLDFTATRKTANFGSDTKKSAITSTHPVKSSYINLASLKAHEQHSA